MLSSQPSPLNRAAILAWQCLLLVCAILAASLIPFLNPELTQFRDRIIGITVLELVSPEYRNAVYILSIIAGICIATALFLLIQWRSGYTVKERAEDRLSYITGGCAVANLLAYVAQGETLFLHASILAFLIFGMQILRPRYAQPHVPEPASDPFFLCFGLSWQLTTGVFMLATWPIGVPFLATFIVLFAVAMLSFEKWYREFSEQFAWVQAVAITWIATLPILFVIAGEISYFTYRNDSLTLDAVWVFAALLSLSAIAGPLYRHKVSHPVYALGALILVSGVIINEYQSTIQYDWYDLFHFGERVLPLQQWTSFSSLPFVDYLPVHGLFDAFPHFIYQRLANSSALEALIWGNGYFMGWVMRAIAVLILYHFLSRILQVKSAFFLIWLLPTYHFLDPYFCLLLIPALHILGLPGASSNNRWWVVQWMLTAALLLWRLDFGAVLIIANIATAIAYSWYIKRTSPLLYCFGWGALVGLGFLCVVMLLLGEHSITDIALQIRSYLSNQTVVTSYPRFYDEIDAATITQYLVFPASAVLIAGLSLSRLLQRSIPRSQLGLDLLLVFLCAISLMLSLRSLHRHSVAEDSVKAYLFVLVGLVFLIRYLVHHKFRLPRAAPLLLATYVMGTYLFLPAGESTAMKAAFQLQPKWEYPIAASQPDLPKWQVHRTRLIDNVDRYDNFTEFMQQSLQGKQSFYDFSNAPLLYALADVKLPVYITETIYQSSDTLQHYTLAQLERRRSRHQLPLVVFRQNSHWDAIDGVDNALRSYLIAEYIYRHYRPCVRVDKFDVWIEKQTASANDCQNRLQGVFTLNDDVQQALSPLSEDHLKQFIDFGALPYLWARYDELDDAVSNAIALEPGKVSPTYWRLKPASTGHACFQTACYLDLTIDSEEEGELTVSFAGRKQFRVTVLEGQHAYRIRISALWHWNRLDSLDAMQLRAETAISVEEARLNVLAH